MAFRATREDYSGRLCRFVSALHRRGLSAFFFMDPVNVFYLTGFESSNAMLLLDEDRISLLTDFRYIEGAAAAPGVDALGLEIHETSRNIIECSSSFMNRSKRWGFDPDYVSHASYIALRDSMGDIFQPVAHMAKTARASKDTSEIRNIVRAQRIVEGALGRAAARMFRPCVTEAQAAAIIDAEIRLGGASGTSFPTMVASGVNAAKPHSTPGRRPLKPGNTIIMDLGARFGNYCSDMTRTVFLDPVETYHRRLYSAVLKAQDAAFRVIKPGIKAGQVDLAARASLEEDGLAEFFGHGVGHGTGLEVHEYPVLGPDSEHVLEPGMIITVEPGVYIPGRGGVRIEELVEITAEGFRRITRLSRNIRKWRFPA